MTHAQATVPGVRLDQLRLKQVEGPRHHLLLELQTPGRTERRGPTSYRDVHVDDLLARIDALVSGPQDIPLVGNPSPELTFVRVDTTWLELHAIEAVVASGEARCNVLTSSGVMLPFEIDADEVIELIKAGVSAQHPFT